MIYTDSRYADGNITQVINGKTSTLTTTVFREYPTESSKFAYYVWVDGDRPDIVAFEQLGSADLWWSIMDLNPEIINPMFITPGTKLRIPRG